MRRKRGNASDPGTVRGPGDPDGLLLPVPSPRQVADAGWYGFTAVPGTAGNAVLVGHVDSYLGPAVFYDLYLLRPGDAVYVEVGARRERFAVRPVREVPKERFPVNEVFGVTGKRQLWLITCGGAFDYATGHYRDNIVVSAAWQPDRRPAKRGNKRAAKRVAGRREISVTHSRKPFLPR